jgi:diguanylate cyclase (GGDEF)-like protein
MKARMFADGDCRMIFRAAKGWLACGTALALVLAAWCRPARALDPGKAFSQYVLTNWTTDAGLPQTSVYSIAQTRDGYLWMGTELGLARFDGVRFAVLNQQNTPALPSNYVHRLLAARDGSLWIGTDSGLVRLKDGRWKTWTAKTGLSDEDIGALAEGSDGSVWVGTDAGLDRVRDGGVQVWHTSDGLPGEKVTALAVDAAGVVWVATRHGLASFDGQHFRAYSGRNEIGDEAVSAMTVARDGSVWAASTHGELSWVVAGKVERQAVALPKNDVEAMTFDHDGNLWIGLQSAGLARLHDGVLTLMGAHSGLPGQTVESLLEDAEHSVWVGTFDGGLAQVRDGKFTVYGKPEGLSSNVNWCAVEAPDGSLWAGTSTGELNHRMADGTVRVYTKRDGLSGEVIHSLLLGRDGTLWIGNRHGVLTSYREGRFRNYQDPAAKNASMNALAEDRDGHLWTGTYGAGLARFEGGKFVHGLLDGAVVALAQSEDGAIWAGTDGDGVWRVQNGGKAHYTRENGLLSDHVLAVRADADGSVWVGTAPGGLNRIRDGRVTGWSQAQGLSDSVVGNILEDRFGNLWMGSDDGIFRVAKRELEEFSQGKIPAIHSVAYDTADGLRSRETMQGGTGTASASADGRLWFATLNGVAAVDPARVLSGDAEVAARIESARFGGKGMALAGSPRLGPGAGRLEIQYTALSFVAPTRLRFRYQLEGYDPGWVDAGNGRSAGYTNLSPGEYTFRVEAARHNGGWSEDAAMVSFSILPPWYRTTTAWCLWVLAIALLTWGVVELRTRSLVRHRKELAFLVAERTAQLREEKLALKDAQKELEKQATHDSLTGLLNRGAILELLEREVARGQREGTVLAVVIADLDHFKLINDTRGHLCGDRVLRDAAERLASCLREYDSIGRYGGEEFLILMPGCDPLTSQTRLDALVASIGDHIFSDHGREIRTSCSFGVTVFRPEVRLLAIEELLAAADNALYLAKATGRNRAHFAELVGRQAARA